MKPNEKTLYRFITRREIINGCPALSHGLLTRAIMDNKLHPIVTGTCEKFHGYELETFLRSNGLAHTIRLKHEAKPAQADQTTASI